MSALRHLLDGAGDLGHHGFHEAAIVAFGHDADHRLGARGADDEAAAIAQAIALDALQGR